MNTRILPGVLLALAAMGAQAQNLKMPEGSEAGMQLPDRGITMDAVEDQFGSPTRVLAAVGEPPITRWIYPNFTVYFEHEFVIHPVIRTRHTGHSADAGQ